MKKLRTLSLALGIFLSVFILTCTHDNGPAASELILPRVVSERETFRVVRMLEGLVHPWSFTFLPDGRILVTERPGRLALVENGRIRRLSGLPDIVATGQGGLLDVILHPKYEQNGRIYFSYSGGSQTELSTRVARARVSGSRLIDVQIIFTMHPASAGGRHFGSRLAFMDDGTLLITLGERGEQDRAQDLKDHAGSTIRLHDDGSVPEDNPFVGRMDAVPEIYTYGNRNAQGMAVQPGTGLVWQHEHGPRGGDEINIIEPGKNYGWPVITYGREYSGGSIGIGTEAPGMEQPILHWTPSIAPSGMTFYSGSLFPAWRGNLFVGALVGRHLRRLVVEGTRVVHQEILLQDSLGRIRDVREGPDGALWLITDSRNGGLYRIEPVQ
jgi:glucose/arabinose dehydrogenase